MPDPSTCSRWRALWPAILLFSFAVTACGTDGPPAASSGESDHSSFIIETTTIFSSSDLIELGWKVQKDFTLEYPESVEARWGFINAKELGVLVYPSAEIARTQGLESALEQIATGPDGQAVGEIDRISCRDAQGQSAVKQMDKPTYGDVPHMVKVGYQSEPAQDLVSPRVCSNKYPTYSEFRILGNMVLLCEGEGRTGNDPSNNCRDLPDELMGN